jgi:hypothetical protein
MYVFIGDSITEWRGGYVDRLASTLKTRGVHPTPFGHELIAREWLKAYQAGPTPA